jgi:hypothetical protein
MAPEPQPGLIGDRSRESFPCQTGKVLIQQVNLVLI